MPKVHRSVFLKSAKERWPHLTDRINSENGILHLEVKHIRDEVQHLIDTGCEAERREALQFIEQSYRHGDSKVKNAIDVSVVEELEFDDRGKLNRSWAWPIVPSKLKELYTAFHAFQDER